MWPKRDDSMKLDPIAVGAIMKHRRIFTPYELAKLIGRDKNEVKAWVTGKRGITWANAHLIADALDCEIDQLTGKKPFVPDPEPSPSADIGGTGILGRIKVDEHFPSWSEEQKAKFLAAIAVLLELDCPLHLVRRAREGCVELNLRLTREQWERLEQAFAAGELAHLKVTKVEPFYDLTEDEKNRGMPSEGDRVTVEIATRFSRYFLTEPAFEASFLTLLRTIIDARQSIHKEEDFAKLYPANLRRRKHKRLNRIYLIMNRHDAERLLERLSDGSLAQLGVFGVKLSGRSLQSYHPGGDDVLAPFVRERVEAEKKSRRQKKAKKQQKETDDQ